MQTEPNMYDVLKASYKNSHEQATSLSRFGYNRDEELSNDNQQAYFNPEKKKLIYTVTGEPMHTLQSEKLKIPIDTSQQMLDSKKPNSNMVSLMHPSTDIVWVVQSQDISVGKEIP